jgi:hypothetical protein
MRAHICFGLLWDIMRTTNILVALRTKLTFLRRNPEREPEPELHADPDQTQPGTLNLTRGHGDAGVKLWNRG